MQQLAWTAALLYAIGCSAKTEHTPSPTPVGRSAPAKSTATPPPPTCEAPPVLEASELPKLFHIRQPLSGVDGVKRIVAISAEDSKTCALDCEGKAYCWPLINELDVASEDYEPAAPKRVLKDSSLRAFATGSAHYCGITNDGSVVCSGRNYSGQLGGSPEGKLVKPSIAGAQSLALRSNNSCALTKQGAYCWGENYENSLGLGGKKHETPTKLGPDITQIAVEHSHSCAVTRQGRVVCFSARPTSDTGCNPSSNKDCALKGAAPAAHPHVGGLPSAATSVSVGGDHSCALMTSGEVYCWGRNGAGESGGAKRSDPWRPHKIEALPKVTQIASGYQHNCAVSKDGAVHCWGSNTLGQSGPKAQDEYRSPKLLEGLPPMMQLSLGATHSCGLSTQGQVVCWGIAIDPRD